MKIIALGIFVAFFVMLTGCTINTQPAAQPRQAQPQYQQQPPKTTRLYFQPKHVENKSYVTPPTAYPAQSTKPKKLR